MSGQDKVADEQHKPCFTDMMYVYSMDGEEMKILLALKKADGFCVKGDILEYVVEEDPDKNLTCQLLKVSDLVICLIYIWNWWMQHSRRLRLA